jgi:hypothetical protein
MLSSLPCGRLNVHSRQDVVGLIRVIDIQFAKFIHTVRTSPSVQDVAQDKPRRAEVEA